MLNSRSPIPLYHQLADIIITKIHSGEYPSGLRIPSENRLAATYGISRPTARQATDLLVRKRMLVRKRGAGTFVEEKQKEVDLFSLAGTIASFHKKGISITTQIIEDICVETVENDSENPFAGIDAYFFSRLSSVDDMPVLLENIYLHSALFSGMEQFNLHGRSLSQIVEAQYYMRPTGGKQNFRIGYLTGKKAESLNISSNIPILTVKRFLHFEQTKNAIYSELYCRTDRFVFSQTIGGISDD